MTDLTWFDNHTADDTGTVGYVLLAFAYRGAWQVYGLPLDEFIFRITDDRQKLGRVEIVEIAHYPDPNEMGYTGWDHDKLVDILGEPIVPSKYCDDRCASRKNYPCNCYMAWLSR